MRFTLALHALVLWCSDYGSTLDISISMPFIDRETVLNSFLLEDSTLIQQILNYKNNTKSEINFHSG